MRLNKFLTEEDALDIEEPETDGDYSDRVVKQNIEKIKKAISKLGEPKNDAEEAILADLEDKLDKWKNVDKETEPAGPFRIPGDEELPPEEAPEEPPKKKEKK